MVKRLRHRPFTAVTRVRFSYGSPNKTAPDISFFANCPELFFVFYGDGVLFKTPMNLHSSQTLRPKHHVHELFETPMNLHSSQTYYRLGNEIGSFETPMNLHSSQTASEPAKIASKLIRRVSSYRFLYLSLFSISVWARVPTIFPKSDRIH